MKNKLYIGVDIGGTKISAALIDSKGRILMRDKVSVAKNSSAKNILKIIFELSENLLDQKNLSPKSLSGIGLGVPGVVNPQKGKIIKTPNLNLSGFPLKQQLKKRFKVKIALDNDVNLGTLGEKWLGSARKAKNVVGIFPGTGVGGGVIIDGMILNGSHGAAAEIGHMIMELHGPKCSCGNFGCLEAFSSRWAIERDIRAAIQKGERTLITQLAKGNLKVIKSKLLREALKRKDRVVTRIIRKASLILGLGCVSVRHIFDPEMIVLGGGLIEACGDFIVPIVRKTVSSDPFFSKISRCRVVPSQLGDDAVLLGAVALVKEQK